MATTTLETAYNTALTLNNVGVSLMERSCYQEAVGVLLEAVQMAKEISSATSPRSDALVCMDDIHVKLKSANQRLAYHSQYDGLVEPTAMGYRIAFVSFEDSMADFTARCLPDRNTISNPILIRLELSATSSLRSTNFSANIEAAVMLYNLGVGHLLLKQTGAWTGYGAKAFKLFEFAFVILNELLGCGCEDEDGCDRRDFESMHTIPLLMLVSRMLVQLAEELGVEREADKFQQALIIQRQLYEIHGMDFSHEAWHRGAPAA